MKTIILRCTLFSCSLVCLCQALLADHPVRFYVRVLAHDGNEGCDVADIDGDGKLDIVAGRNWYRNGEWTPRAMRIIEDNNGYVRSNGDSIYDVNADGRPDVVSIDFLGSEVYWYENPGGEPLMQGYLWPKHLLGDTEWANNEVSYLIDLNQDGKPEFISNQWVNKNPMLAFSFTKETRQIEVTEGRKTEWVEKEIPTLIKNKIGEVNGHGIGFGDVNDDGRDDIVFGNGWYECPEGDRLAGVWKYHPDWEKKHAACPMLVFDVDGDGVTDVINSVAHGYGIHWWRGLGPGDDGKLQFEEHLIDDSFSQPHCLALADFDGDGTQELITGKRVRAHNGKDPGGLEPPVMKYYVWDQESKSFEVFPIVESTVGIGLQIRTADLDDDGDVDIVVAGKEGTQILFNARLHQR
ncbi:FG-GAP repeat domain-containing protein [Novipirellula artificiosorum]|uniref:FG-GAP repeat protein n=1 Tax=Novipirellula artificiosorum TaxID=2528016 RepID=A0A5C6DNL9_9BACT|nr:VCBS repeat-containing protein [Novipirellula artificiosorum]TWU38202.1 FG-GAP repeat protein [Novipirellula artificiosorum]